MCNPCKKCYPVTHSLSEITALEIKKEKIKCSSYKCSAVATLKEDGHTHKHTEHEIFET